MNKAVPVELGGDIVFYDGNEPQIIATLQKRRRFLNVLWLPCSLAQLSPKQIAVINRFREEWLCRDNQFKHANQSRHALITLLTTINAYSVLEIGCGKFPVAEHINLDFYRGIEIDPIAIEHCRNLGLEVGQLSDFIGCDQFQFDIAVSLYVFHFSISQDLISYLDCHLTASACLIFSLIADESTDLLTKLALLSRHFPSLRVVKTDTMARREFFLVMSREAGGRRAAKVALTLEGLLTADTTNV